MIIAKNDISIQEIKSIFENQNAAVGDTIFDLMKCFKLAKLCKSLFVSKLMGYSVPSIVITLTMFLIMLVKTVHGFILSNYRLSKARGRLILK